MSHSFTRKVLKWPFCAKCGLVALRNRVSDKAQLKDCPGKRERVDVSFAIGELDSADKVWSGLKAHGWKRE